MQLADASNTRQLRGETRSGSPKAFKSSGKPSHLISDLLARSHARWLRGRPSPCRRSSMSTTRLRAVSMHAKMLLLPAILDGGEQSGIARTSTLVTHGKGRPTSLALVPSSLTKLPSVRRREALTSAVSRALEKDWVGGILRPPQRGE
jgi:hypothetical protein